MRLGVAVIPSGARRPLRLSGLLALGWLVLAALGAACSSSSSYTIHIYSSLPLQGSGAPDVQSVVDSIRMALADHNGRAGPFTVSYTSLDDSTAKSGKWDPDREALNARRVSADPNAVGYIGPRDSGAAKVSIPILNRVQVAMVSPSTTYPGLTKTVDALPGEPYIYSPLGPDQRNFCRVVPTDDLQGAAGALYAQQSMKASSVYVLDDTQLYGHGIAQVFNQKAQSLGMKVVGYSPIDLTATDFSGLARQIVGTNPDLVYFGGIAENHALDIVKALRTAGFKGSFMGPDGIAESSFAQGASQNVIVTLVGLSPDQLKGSGADWYARYKRAHGNQEPGAYAAYGYESMNALLNAIAQAAQTQGGKPSREAVLAALRAQKNVQGITGTWSFDADCDTTLTPISILQVQNGRFNFVGLAPQP
jgi:branched-chain amino acid transport system substrate-binding protein